MNFRTERIQESELKFTANPKEILSVGSIIILYDEYHILSQVLPKRVCAISLRNGNRYRDPAPVENITHISQRELADIVGSAPIQVVDKNKVIKDI